jgi:DNA-binding SARP family transcriptional activator
VVGVSWPRRVTGAALVVAVLVAPPWLLAAVAAPLLPGWPTAAQMRDWVADPLTPGTLRAGLVVLAWLLWLAVAYTLVVTAGRRLRAGARWVRRLPLPTPWQAAATSMAGAAALTTAHTPTPSLPTPPATASAGDLHQQPADTAWTHTGEGVTIPGGWLPDDTARQVAAAATLVWLRRRRTYRPGRDRTAEPLTPLAATVTAVQTAVADHQHAAPTSTGATVADLPAPAVAFIGDGAADAARGMLVTYLLAALRDPPDRVRVLVTRDTLTALLPDLAAADDAITGLRIVDTAEQATATLSARYAMPTRSDDDSGPPVLLLIANPPQAAAAEQMTALPAEQARIITLRPTRFTRTWHIDRYGHTRDEKTQQAAPRLCVLDQTAATDLLTVLAHPTITALDAATPPPPPPRPADQSPARIPRQPGRDTPRVDRQPPPVTPSTVQLQVLGRPVLLVNGRPVTIRRSAALQVLVFLAVHPDGATTTDLVQAIWPGLPTHSVTARLYTTLSDLRAAIRAATTAAVLGHTDDRYHLNPAHIDVDLWRLRTAAGRPVTDLTGPSAAWQPVIDAYTGDLATGHTWPWVDPPREATRRLVLDAYASLTEAHTNPHERLRLLQHAIRIDPYNQALHQRAAEHLTALGDPTAADRLLRTHRQLLDRDGVPADNPTGVTPLSP